LTDQAKNRSKPANNTSGDTGISEHFNRIGTLYIRARCFHKGKEKTRYFNVNKLGYQNAWDMAVKARRDSLDCMNYSEDHGL